MASFGDGVNASLGAINYAPYMQGAVAGAQSMGQGMAGGMQAIGQGIQKYIKEQDENKMMAGNLMGTDKKIIAEASKDPLFAKTLESISLGKSPSRKDVLYATAKVATLEKNQERAIKQFEFDQLKDRAYQQRQLEKGLKTYDNLLAMGLKPEQAKQAATLTGALGPQGLNLIAQREQEAAQTGLIQAQSDKARQPAAGKQPSTYHSVRNGLIQAHREKNNGSFPNAVELSAIDQIAAKAGSSSTNFLPGEKSFDIELGKELAPRHLREHDAAVNSGFQLQKLQELKTLLDTGDLTTGYGAEVLNDLNRVRAQFLADKAANKTVTNTQILDALLGEGVFGMIGTLGLGSKNFDTPAEMERIKAAFTGDKGFTTDAIKAITDYRIRATKQAAKNYRKNKQAGVYDKFYESTKYPEPDLSFLDKAPDKSTASPAGKVVVQDGVMYRINPDGSATEL